MIYYKKGSEEYVFSEAEIKEVLYGVFEKLGPREKVLAIPPDFTRYHSRAGELTAYAWQYFGQRLTDILPALGTHRPMEEGEIDKMFPGVPKGLFRTHQWRSDVVTLGEVPPTFIEKVTGGLVSFAWPAQVNRLLTTGGHDLILSIGQVVPHEVIGMANYNKNIFVGTGGAGAINKSHFVGAVYGMERIMGRANNPVRQILNYASNNFARHLPLIYILTVIGKNNQNNLVIRGLYIGDDEEVFELAANLSMKVNFEMVPTPLKKVVVYLDPEEFKTTWLGNKAIYRTRMALADGADLIILAPEVEAFGEDIEIDRLIRKYGYRGTTATLNSYHREEDLQSNPGAAAHLIHGSSEGRFEITYATARLSKEEVESVGYRHAPLEEMLKKYPPDTLQDGENRLPGGETVFFIRNPALGLWAHRDRFFEG